MELRSLADAPSSMRIKQIVILDMGILPVSVRSEEQVFFKTFDNRYTPDFALLVVAVF